MVVRIHGNLGHIKLLLKRDLALLVSTIAILIRSSFRVAELSGGFHGALANNETTFMVLDGVMIIAAIAVLTVLHPGVSFQGAWSAANFTLRKSAGLKPADTENGISKAEGLELKQSRWPGNFMLARRSSKSKGAKVNVGERSASGSVNEEPKPFRSISYEETR